MSILNCSKCHLKRMKLKHEGSLGSRLGKRLSAEPGGPRGRVRNPDCLNSLLLAATSDLNPLRKSPWPLPTPDSPSKE